jgi:PAS domain S-box-containing protein
MTDAAPLPGDARPAGTGELARRLARHCWAETPLGPFDEWPLPLKTLVTVMMGSTQPMFVAWGPERTLIYNDAYTEILARKHPEALGRPFLDVWDEIRGDLLPIVERAYAGEPVQMDDITLWMERRGHREETHFAFSYTPVRDEAGTVAGFFCACQEITRQVMAERQLRQSEARLRGVLEGMGEAFGILDRDFRILAFNDAALRLEGRPRPEIIGRSHWDVYPGSEDSDLGRLFKRAMAEEQPAELEHRYTWADGTARWLEMRAYPVPEGLAVFWRDISERKEAEARLRESEARFRLMADAVPQIVWITDAEGRVEFFNRHWFDYTGAPDEPSDAGEVSETYVHSDDGAQTMAAFETARRTGDTFLVEHRICSRAGEYRWFLVRGEPHRDPASGRILRWYGASVDIHDRKLAEAALRASEARLRALNETLEAEVAARTAERDRMWQTSPDLMLVIDFDGVFRRVNPAWTRILGYAPEELVGHHVTEFVVPGDHAVTVEAYELAAAGASPRIENRYRHKDGSERWISWTAAPAGELTYATGRDVTAKKARQAELEATQEQLRQAQKMEALGQLTGGVAHDFNNLLTPIIGSLDMLLSRGVGSERERRLMDGALQAAERARTVVQRLLAFARRQPLQPGPVDLRRLVEGMAELVASTTGPRIALRTALPDDLPPVLGDANQLEMALINLAVNARDAMPEGGTLTVSAAVEEVDARRQWVDLTPGTYVRISITDTGIGMDEATRARAIDPFFSTKGIGKGTGLGLSMVHGLVSQLGGGLTIESTPDAGTTIGLWLRISETEAEADAVEAIPETAQERGTVLLVDDEALVRMAAADMLNDLGYAVVEARSAEDALRLVNEGLVPDLVVTDHLMPGRSGVDLARDLRQRRPDLPVLIASGYAEMDSIAPDLPRLGKPFRAAELAERVAALSPTA